MKLTKLNAVCPIDGRYRDKTLILSDYFSERALLKYRTKVEIEYFISLCELGLTNLEDFDNDKFSDLRNIYLNFSLEDARRIKTIEKTTNHDVKAVEYFVKEKFDALGLERYKEFIHFGLTSQDINNTAIPLSIKDAIDSVYIPEMQQLTEKLAALVLEWKDVPMLARTHGQPASPTRLGKEIEVFTVRLTEQLKLLRGIPNAAKFGGATGNFNAHKIAYPSVDWRGFATDFVENRLGLHYSFPTTQIEHYDYLATLFDNLKRINNILIDLSRDIWSYISMDYFKQKIKKDEVGSSAMPHKVNPIDFENAEGNFGIANSLFEHFAGKLPISRLQRDLTDSTVLRNVGVPFGHTLVGFKSTLKGLNKLMLNALKLEQDLENNWAVVSEAIQTVLRKGSYPNPYEALKGLTRTNQKITRQSIAEFIDKLDVSKEIKSELKNISPFNYTGI